MMPLIVFQVPRPNSIIIAVYGVLSSLDDQTAIVEEYIRQNMQQYFEETWDTKQMKMVRDRLLKENRTDLASKGNVYVKLPRKGTHEELIPKFYEYTIARMQKPLPQSSIINKIKEWIMVDGYNSGKLKSHVYDDVPKVLHVWRMEMMIKLFSFEKGDAEGQK